MEALTISTNNVVANAVKFMANNIDTPTSISKGMMMETLKKRMMRGEVCRFAYMKKDGSVRIAVGTLQKQAVQANVEGTGIPKRYFGMFAYLDLEKMAWRGFKETNFIGIID
jgi:hypothetical protein